MLQVVEFPNVRVRRYGLQNTWTGLILPNKRGKKYARYWTIRGAVRSMNKRTQNLNNTIRDMAQKY